MLFSLLITANKKSLFVCCLPACMVGLRVSALYIIVILMVHLCFILALNCTSRKEHCPNKCLFDLCFEYHNFRTAIKTRVIKAVFAKSLNYTCFLHSRCILFIPLHTVLRRYSACFISKNKISVIK